MALGPIEILLIAFPGNQFNGEILPELERLVEAGTISSKGAKKVYQALESEGGVPHEIVQRLGLAQLNDPDKIAALVNQAIADNPAQLAQYRAGNQRLFGFFVGAVLKASNGTANPEVVNKVLRAALTD